MDLLLLVLFCLVIYWLGFLARYNLLTNNIGELTNSENCRISMAVTKDAEFGENYFDKISENVTKTLTFLYICTYITFYGPFYHKNFAQMRKNP